MFPAQPKPPIKPKGEGELNGEKVQGKAEENGKKLAHAREYSGMYKRRNGQMNALECPVFFGGVKLDPSNQWVRLSTLMPWDFIEEQYAANLEGVMTANPAKPSRMAVGTLIIKERYRFSDEDTVEEIRMNPNLQYYLGMPEFSHEEPFDASTITRFRKRQRSMTWSLGG